LSFFEELKRRNVVRVGIAYGVATWLLIQVTDTVFPRIGLPDSAVTLVIALLFLGFIPALIFAWAFEMTPEGIKREKDVERDESITPATGKRLDRLIIGGLVLIIAGMAVERAWFAGRDETIVAPDSAPSAQLEVDPNAEPALADQSQTRDQDVIEQKSVAVLPFTLMSSGEDDGYFADGLTEEILNSLARLPELLVTARTSSFHFKGQNIPVPEIGKTLGVDHIVEGSIRRAGDRVRITAQLVRSDDGFHLWSDTYDRTLEDVFAVQEDIAEHIAEMLGVVLDEDKWALMRKAGIRDVEAFIAYQKGLEAFSQAHLNMSGIVEKLEAVNSYFERALEAAPDLIAARVLKADATAHQLLQLITNVRKAAYPGEGQDVLDALRMEYDLAWESAVPGNQRDILDVERSIFANNWIGLAAKASRALQPGDCPQSNWMLEVVSAMGMGAQVVDKAREEMRCNPYDAYSQSWLVYALTWNGDPHAALLAAEEAQSRGILYESLEDSVVYALLAMGEVNDPRVRLAGAGYNSAIPLEILLPAVTGDTEQARQIAEAFWTSPEADDRNSVMVAAVVGDRQRANELAARIDAHPGGPFVLANLTHGCGCGAPFDLDATPNLKARIEEAGFTWPPSSQINYPAKDW